MRLISTGRQIGLTIKNASRVKKIVGVFARHGFQNVAERLRLGRFVLDRFSVSDVDKFSAPQRTRMAFEQLGPTFVKLGQLLATRPDLIPEEFVEEFKKLHSKVQTLPFSELKLVLEDHFGQDYSGVFRHIDEEPLAAASIAQVHRATLISEESVVVKIQRPGIVDTINEDLGVLYQLAVLLEKYVPELEIYDPVGIIDEFFKHLQLETDFIVEANNLRRFGESFKDDPDIVIPKVYLELSGPRVLVMEALEGVPLSEVSLSDFSPSSQREPKEAVENSGDANAKNDGAEVVGGACEEEGALTGKDEIDPDKVVESALNCYFKMVFSNGVFHGDLHSGNFFILPGNRIGLIDFGVVGRLNRRTQDSIASMLLALANEDYDRVAFEYVDLAPFNEKLDVDKFAKDLGDLVAPYYGLTMKNINVGKLLMDSATIAAKHRVKVPSELMLYFKSMMHIEGLGRAMVKDFDFLDHALKFSGELLKEKFDPSKMGKDWANVLRDSATLVHDLPRQLRQTIRKINSPDFVAKLRIENSREIQRAIERTGLRMLLGLVLCGLFVGTAIMIDPGEIMTVFGVPWIVFTYVLLASLIGVTAFFNYWRR